MTPRNRMASLAVALLLAVPAAATAAAPERVAELMEVTKVEQNVGQMQAYMAKAMDDGFNQEAQRRAMQGEPLERARAAHEAMKKDLLQALAWQEMGPEITAIYEKQLTDAEVDAAIAYYSTPEGASMLQKQPALTQATMQLGQQRAQAIVPKLQAQMQAIFEKEAPAPSAPAAPSEG